MPTPLDRQRRILLRGSPDPLDHGLPLAAGPLAARYFPGELRYLRLGPHTLALRLYAAVRDENWGTVPTTLATPQITTSAQGFDISITGQTTHPDIHFDFAIRFTANVQTDGSVRLSARYTGTVRSAFRRNRLGWCILHPASLAGAPLTLLHPGGASLEARFPRLLDPRQPPPGFTDLTGLTHTLPDGSRVEFRFTGDAFEMEDQRNWTDASYKTFCTPLARPFPVQLQPGDTVDQTVEITVLPASAPSVSPTAVRIPAPTVALPAPASLPRLPAPALGTVLAADPPTSDEALDLARIGLHHLRVNLHLADPDWPARLASAGDLARGIEAGLELAVYLPAQPPADWDTALADAAARCHAPVRYITLLHAFEQYKGQPFLSFNRGKLLQNLPHNISLATGTDGDAIFLGRLTGTPPFAADTISVQINPQTHATDELSLLETLAVQGVVVETAAVLGLGRRVAVSPVALTPRLNLYAYATGNFAPVPPDPRIKSLFAAGWTLGSYAALAAARAHRITFHTASGPAGIALTPTAHLLEQLCFPTPTHLTPLRTPSPDDLPPTCSAVLLHAPGHTRLLVANHTDAPLTLRLPPPASAREGALTLHLLDETYTPASPPPRRPIEPDQPLDLPAYALAIIDGE